jgi:hypothetical protein
MTSSEQNDPTSPGNATAPGAEAGETAAVLHDLATSIALLPQVAPPEGEEQPEGAIALPVIEQDGQRFVPVFTSEDALRAAGADVGTALRIPIAQLAANWPEDDIWLAVNPASEEGIGLPPDIVRMLPMFAAGPNGSGESAPDTGPG